MKKFCVIGAGAIGGRLAARLAMSGYDVSVTARGAHLAAILQHGLTLRDGAVNASFNVRAAATPAEIGEVQDVVIIGLKAHQVPSVLPALQPLIGPDTLVMPAINGLPWWYFHRDANYGDQRIECLDGNGELKRALDPDHIIGCVVHASAEVVEPGVIHANGQNKLVIGEPSHQPSARVAQLAAALATAGFDVKQSTRIRDDIWMKLVGNASFNPVAALTLSRMDELCANPPVLDLVRKLMEEVMAVARAYGCDPQLTAEERIRVGCSIGRVKISMHQDVERDRPLELDAIVRAPLELGRRAGIAMPHTETVLAMADALNQRILSRQPPTAIH
jgi:2-dehydropantoate 2-reductase